jgi:hypothetical protein
VIFLNFFAESIFFCSRRRNSSPRVFFFAENIFFTLAKEIFADAESLRLSSHRRILLSAKTRFPVVHSVVMHVLKIEIVGRKYREIVDAI